uniref:(northern house mosquito) hypothetical protein n=1 Tax=Culex pipiens TaxID=7175 RepID=A0A8D8HSZ6_CULPI
MHSVGTTSDVSLEVRAIVPVKIENNFMHCCFVEGSYGWSQPDVATFVPADAHPHPDDSCSRFNISPTGRRIVRVVIVVIRVSVVLKTSDGGFKTVWDKGTARASLGGHC